MCRAEFALVFPADSQQDGYPGLSLDMDVHNLKHSQHLAAKIHHPTNVLTIKSCPKRRMSGQNGFMSNTELFEMCPFPLRDLAAG